MKLFKSLLGQDDLESRISELERRMDAHTEAMRTIADAIKIQSNAIVSISNEFKLLIKQFGIEDAPSSNFKIKIKSDDTYH
jgi:uncharacterized coiled-coil protein SlyX